MNVKETICSEIAFSLSMLWRELWLLSIVRVCVCVEGGGWVSQNWYLYEIWSLAEDFHLVCLWLRQHSRVHEDFGEGIGPSLSQTGEKCLYQGSVVSPSLDVWTHVGPSPLPTLEHLVSLWGQDVISKRTASWKNILKHFPGDWPSELRGFKRIRERGLGTETYRVSQPLTKL